MKHLIFSISLFLITACSSIESNNIASGYTQAFIAIKNAIKGYENTSINRALVENIPYASSLVRVGNGPYGLMILESIKGDSYTWVTADGIYLVIKKGKIIKTKGFNNNLYKTLTPPVLDKSNFKTLIDERTLKYYYSFDNPLLVDLEIDAEYRIIKKELITILDRSKELTLIHESLSSELIYWKVINKYWVDSDYFVWKSEQTISPKLPSLSFEITKKPSK